MSVGYLCSNLNLEERSEGSPHQIKYSVRPSVHLCIQNMKTCRFFIQESKLGYPRGVICPLSIPSKYLFLCARRKFGFNKKIRRNLLTVYVYYQPNSCNKNAEHEWCSSSERLFRNSFLYLECCSTTGQQSPVLAILQSSNLNVHEQGVIQGNTSL